MLCYPCLWVITTQFLAKIFNYFYNYFLSIFRTVNNQPYFIQNGNRSSDIGGEPREISTFRRALPQFLAVSAKNILLFGK